MTDMLVKLYNLPSLEAVITEQKEAGIDIRRALAGEKEIVIHWIRQNFNATWGSECEVAFAQVPISCFIAVEADQLVGFAVHDAACRNFFGPTGVSESYRGRGIGKALLLACLHAMAAQGYAYAIIGWVGPADFYAKAVGAIPIEDSAPGIYRGMLK